MTQYKYKAANGDSYGVLQNNFLDDRSPNDTYLHIFSAIAAPMVADLAACLRGATTRNGWGAAVEKPKNVRDLVVYLSQPVVAGGPDVIWNGQVLDHSCLSENPATFANGAACGKMSNKPPPDGDGDNCDSDKSEKRNEGDDTRLGRLMRRQACSRPTAGQSGGAHHMSPRSALADPHKQLRLMM